MPIITPILKVDCRQLFYIWLRHQSAQDLRTFTDDIILDETPPKVNAASVAGASAAAAHVAKLRKWTLKVKATDSNSGVDKVQATSNKRKPGKLLAYKKKLTVKSATKPKWVRARDRAGNFSKWRKAR